MLSILGRVLGSFGVLFVVSVVLFALVYANPVSPARIVLGADAAEVDIATFEKDHGLDQPVVRQYIKWASNLARGDLGKSYFDDGSISRTIGATMPVTLELVIWSFLLALLIAVPLGILSALKEDSWIDQMSRVIATLGVSIPTFWLGLIFVAWFSVKLRWFPAGGYVPWSGGFGAHMQSLALPAISLGLYYVAIISRMTRSSVGDVLMADHVRVARAMGLPRSRILVYVLRNALTPIITVSAMSFGYMFGWALIVEQVFNIPGMSRALLNAIFRRDYLIIVDVVLIITAMFLIANLIADILYRLVDPRVST